MDATGHRRLPLQRVLEELDSWQARPTATRLRRVATALRRLVAAYGADGALVEIDAPPLPPLRLAVGSLASLTVEQASQRAIAYPLHGADGALDLGRAWLSGPATETTRAAHAVELAFDAAWSRAEARAAGRRLAALDAAVRGIAGVLSVDRVLQLIVNRVRDLSDAEYAALGIVGADGYLERFLTSGIDAQTHARIGALPRGRGLLGLIIREDRSLRIEDIALDSRRAGFPPHHPEMHSFLGVPVRSKGVSVGNLYLTNKRGAPTFSDTDQRLVEMFALHAGIAIESARLHEEVGRLAVVAERQRISQDLHDGIIQSLYALSLTLEDLPEAIAASEADGSARVDRAIDSIHQIIRDIRNFIVGLDPELLEEADLAGGLRSLGEEFKVNTLTDLELHLDETLPDLPAGVAGHLLAIAREALSNVARHAGATRARLELARSDGTIELIIGDNGCGFDTSVRHSEEHHGLVNLRSRAAALGGSLSIHSEPDVGTRVELRVPLTASVDQLEAEAP